jgi:transcriptional regulator with XRE-family HTH domain
MASNENCVSVADMFDFSVLREMRRGLDLTIAEVSARSGVSPAVISKLERNQTNAELETLYKLARVFGINTTELLKVAERLTSQKTTEKEYVSSGFRFRQIRYGNLRCMIGSAPAGGWVSRPEAHADDYELCWCIEGAVQITLPGECYDLRAGDAVQFDAVLEHRYEAVSDCRVIVIHIRKDKRF